MKKNELIKKIKEIDALSNDEKTALIELLSSQKRYGLVWEDKPEDVEEELSHKLPILKEVVERRIIADENSSQVEENDNTLFEGQENEKSNQTPPNHILIEGDNLHALSVLNYTHAGKVDVIYIDPPYNTGEKDFRYNDTYVNREDAYLHSKWLSFMYKRLVLAKKLLTNQGLIVVSIDDNEVAQIKILLDELFNENTKIVAVKMSEASGLKMGAVKKSGIIPKYKEFVIFAKLNGVKDLYFDMIKKGEWDNEYNIFIDNFTEEQKLYIDSISEKEEIFEDDINYIDEYILKNIVLTTVQAKLKELNINKNDIEKWKYENSWRICRSTASNSVKKLADDKRHKINQTIFSVISKRDRILYIVKGDYDLLATKPRVQMLFASDNLTIHPGDFWSDIKTTGLDAEGGVTFKNGKKPIALLKRIIKTNIKSSSTILDFFAGSGSTLHATMQLNAEDGGNRQCILVTNNENNIAEEVCYERNKRVINGYTKPNGDKVAGLKNNNLRYYKTDFVDSAKSLKNRLKLMELAKDMLCIKDDCYNEISSIDSISSIDNQIKLFENDKIYLMIIYDEEAIPNAIEIIKLLDKKVNVYIFSPGQYPFTDDFEEVLDKVELCALPEAIYKAYKSILPKKKTEVFIETKIEDIKLKENESYDLVELGGN